MTLRSALSYFFISIAIIFASIFILHKTNYFITSSKKDTLDAFVNHATFLEYDKQGNLNKKIQASRMMHYHSLKTSFFTNLQVLIYSSHLTPWQLEADHGKIDDNGSQFDLWQNVRIRQLSPQTQLVETTIKTDKLTVFPKTEEAKQRLEVLTKTQDGFVIAEEDLKLRGPGEFFGVRQSGAPIFRLADLARDAGWLLKAREEAKRILEDDPQLARSEHQRLLTEIG